MKTSLSNSQSLKYVTRSLKELRFCLNMPWTTYLRKKVRDYTNNFWNLKNSMELGKKWKMLS